MKKVSIIVPVYNAEKHVETCIQSILRQSYPDFELILVDDGSSDLSGTICDQFSKNDARILVFHQENGGVSSARNLGMKHISGEYVLFIDADDYLDEDMIEFLVTLLESHGADISQCGYRRIVGDTVRLVNDTKKTYVMDQEEALGCLITGKRFASGLWNKLFRIELVRDIRFDTTVAINEDVLFAFQAFLRAKTIVFADFLKYNYVAYFGESAIFNTAQEKKTLDACRVNEKIYHAVSDNPALRTKAANRYLSSLFQQYRLFTKTKKDKSSIRHIKSEIYEISGQNNDLSRNMKLSCFLLKTCPFGYRFIYDIYDKKRKPNWDVEVDE